MICLYCNKEFEIPACKYFERNTRGKFCSRPHWILGWRYSTEEFRKTKNPVEISPIFYKHQKPLRKTKCKKCGLYFEISISILDKGYGKFCSKKCAALSLRKRVKVICEYCGIEFERRLYHYIHDGKHRYCSPKCRIKGRIIIR